MNKLKIQAFVNGFNIESFTVKNDDIDYDLDANGVTRIEVIVCGDLVKATTGVSSTTISSDNNDVTYSGINLNVKFGQLNLISGKYYPKVKIFSPTFPDGAFIAGQGMAQEILLTMAC